MQKRFMAAVLAALLLALGSAGALADNPPTRPAPTEVKKVSFTLTSKQCSALPQGVTIKGAGTSRKFETFTQAADGTMHYNEVTVISGAATDNKGGRYWFDYHDDFSTAHTAVPYVALVTDHFDLVSRGAFTTGLHTFFVAEVTVTSEDPFQATFKPTFVLGDPLDFATLASHCDPL